MQRHLILSLDAETTFDDTFRKAKAFLSDNGCLPLLLTVSDSPDTASIFQQALASFSAAVNQDLTIDPEARVFLITADLSAPAPSASPDSLVPQQCQCDCGGHYATGCGGGGGGGSRSA
jgi:hypothetical protein